MMNGILDYVVLGNPVLNYLIAAGYFAVGLVIVWILKKIVITRLKQWADRTSTQLDDFVISALERSVVPLFYFEGKHHQGCAPDAQNCRLDSRPRLSHG
jgi:hypothetical protein